MNAGSPIRAGSAHDVYLRLKALIMGFELYPGSRVTETELAARFGVSRTPVREALQRLQFEGYLTVRPKQGCFIREIDIEEYVNDVGGIIARHPWPSLLTGLGLGILLGRALRR